MLIIYDLKYQIMILIIYIEHKNNDYYIESPLVYKCTQVAKYLFGF